MSAQRIVRQLPPMDGDNIGDLPAGLIGRAVTAVAIQPARAARVLAGILAAKDRLLLITITSNDLDWDRKIWLSIVAHRASFQPRHQRRTESGKRGCREQRYVEARRHSISRSGADTRI